MWNFLEKFVSRLMREPASVTIASDNDRVIATWSNRVRPASFAWNEVEEIETFKRDLFAYDEICLAFRVSDLWYEFWESDTGFNPLAKQMQGKFPSIPEGWYGEVMRPPFVTNRRTLWKRG